MELTSSRWRATLSFYRDRAITILRTLGGKRLAIDDLRVASAPALIERGKNDDGLIIAFTGLDDRLFLRVWEFFDTTKALGYSRILLRDKYRLWYQRGIDRKRPDFPSLIAYLRKEIAALRPKKIMCVGTSAAGYVAIMAGHELGADYVHAFAPQTFLDTSVKGIRQSRYKLPYVKLRLSKRAGKLFDLFPLLNRPNGKTTYFIHYSKEFARDREHARRISGLPGVASIGYPCAAHAIAIFLAKRAFLQQTLDIANQDRLIDMARAHFPDGLDVDEPRPL